MTANDFSIQFAIALPNGDFHRRHTSGFESIFDPARPDSDGEVMVFTARGEAERTLAQLQERATRMGMNLCGLIVQRLCSPFVIDDPATVFAAEVEEWMGKQ